MIQRLLDHPRMHFFEGDITINKEWIVYHVKKCDVILPLVAICMLALMAMTALAETFHKPMRNAFK